MGTEYLMIILLWCGDPNGYFQKQTALCREKAIKCVRELKNFTTDDVIDKCLQPKKINDGLGRIIP
jgi:hypothetical protein